MQPQKISWYLILATEVRLEPDLQHQERFVLRHADASVGQPKYVL